jgi:hypothetical protein
MSSAFQDHGRCQHAGAASPNRDTIAATQIAKNSSMISFGYVESLMRLEDPEGRDERVQRWIRASIYRQRAQVLAQQMARLPRNNKPICVSHAIVHNDGVLGKWLANSREHLGAPILPDGVEQAELFKAELYDIFQSQDVILFSMPHSDAHSAIRVNCESCSSICAKEPETLSTMQIKKSLKTCMKTYTELLSGGKANA